jgi:hypothetical protein
MIEVRAERMSDAFVKFHLSNLPPYAVMHEFTAPDNGDPHDHPFSADITVVSGGYVEEVFDLATGASGTIERKPGDSFRNDAGKIHRIIALPTGRCLTLFVPGEHERTPGFYQWRDGKPWHRFWHDQDFTPLP